MAVVCYLYVALQRLLQNKNSSGTQRKSQLCGGDQTQQPLSGECTPSEARFEDGPGLILPTGTVIVCRNSNLILRRIYIVICQTGR